MPIDLTLQLMRASPNIRAAKCKVAWGVLHGQRDRRALVLPCPAPVWHEAAMKAPRYPGGTLRLSSRPRDEAAPALPSPIPPETVPAATPLAQPDPAEAVVQQGAPPKCELETREAAAARRRQQTREVLALLRARWPEAFAAPVPLALGIIKEIRGGLGETHVPAMQLGRALHFWTSGPGYLAAVADGRPRRHLDGTEAGEPDEGHRQHARDTLAKRAGQRGQAGGSSCASPPGT